MIPRKIHYCWFGRGEMPQLVKDCIASWHEHMPDWEYKLWNEDSFDVNRLAYTREAYAAGKYAFVSDVARLYALQQEGGVYLDTDVMVFKSFEPLLRHSAFAGFEGSKYLPIGTFVMASIADGEWVNAMIRAYDDLSFLLSNNTYDLTTNVQRLTSIMAAHGLRQDGIEQDYLDLHIFPVDYFCPRQTTGEYILTQNTYCDHRGMGSWSENSMNGWKSKVKKIVGNRNMIRLIKLKRKMLG